MTHGVLWGPKKTFICPVIQENREFDFNLGMKLRLSQ